MQKININRRLKIFIESQGLNASSFAKKASIEKQSVSNYLNQKNTPSNRNLQKILEKFPDLNETWLLKGEGEMINKEFLSPVGDYQSEEIYYTKKELLDRVQDLTMEYKRERELNDILIKRITELENLKEANEDKKKDVG